VSSRFHLFAASAVSALVVSGCTGVVAVKNVESDKFGYLSKTFSVQSVPSAVASQIAAQDHGPLPFHRMVLSVTPQVESAQVGVALQNYRSSWTIINVGGPYVQFLDEQMSNGVDTRQDYGVSYRNLFMVRGQTMLMDRTNSSLVMEAKSLQTFTPVSLGGAPGGSLEYHYTWGNQAQLANFSDLAIHCAYGARYPASRLNARLVGEAQELNCDHVNKNGIVSDHSTRALLVHYGVAVITRNQTATAAVNFKIDNVSID